MWVWIIPGLVLVLPVASVLRRGQLYYYLFADEHFREVALGLRRVRTEALARIDSRPDEIFPPDDPRNLTTSAGLILFYTIGTSDGECVHHYSVSVAGANTPHAVAEIFIVFVAKLLGVPLSDLQLAVTQSMVHHAAFSLDERAQKEFARRTIPETTWQDVASFQHQWRQDRQGLQWHRLPGTS